MTLLSLAPLQVSGWTPRAWARTRPCPLPPVSALIRLCVDTPPQATLPDAPTLRVSATQRRQAWHNLDMHPPALEATRPNATHVVCGAAFTAAMVTMGHVAIGPLIAIVFASGFVTGFVLWLVRPGDGSFCRIKVPYILVLVASVIHRVDEEISGFVPAIEELTGDTAADPVSLTSLILVVLSLAWMLSPLLMRIGNPLGSYGAWTLFAGFGILELWHFVFPLMAEGPYGYFPGMWTVPLVAPIGWWGMWRMWTAGDWAPSELPTTSRIRDGDE